MRPLIHSEPPLRAARAVLLLLCLAAPPAAAQTLLRTETGINPNDRSGTVVSSGAFLAPLPTACIFGQGVLRGRVSGAPGWSSSTGRVEFWSGSGIFNGVTASASTRAVLGLRCLIGM